MKNFIPIILMIFGFFSFSGGLYGLGEQTLILGGEASWEAVGYREGITEVDSVRPSPVLVLSSARTTGTASVTGMAAGAAAGTASAEAALDMAFSFDEGRADLFADQTGHYRVEVSPGVSAVTRRWARTGLGAAHFMGNTTSDTLAAFRNTEALIISPRSPEALLYPGRRFEDFSLEFWLYPMNMENGEQILHWSAIGQTAWGDRNPQHIQCVVVQNQLQWTFSNFFASPDDRQRLSLTFRGRTSIIPQAWSHHLIRFDARTGLLEYLVNGVSEEILYASSNGREGGDVYTPVAGQGGRLVLGGRFLGLMDEFRLTGVFAGRPLTQKYPLHGGRIETGTLDLGESRSQILRVDALGGRVSAPGGVRPSVSPLYGTAGSGSFNFPDDSAIRLFIRFGESSYIQDDTPWLPIEPGTDFSEQFRGRYLQLAAEFYPSGDGETSPYLEALRLTYIPDEPPRPPSLLTVVPRDGAVDLSWRAGPDHDTIGYLVYYGTSQGEFFGDDAALGASPINVGKRSSIRIDGLKNGVLYYFAVVAYDRLNPIHGGEFSREASARPLRMIE